MHLISRVARLHTLAGKAPLAPAYAGFKHNTIVRLFTFPFFLINTNHTGKHTPY
jgi:hypothetical protein